MAALGLPKKVHSRETAWPETASTSPGSPSSWGLKARTLYFREYKRQITQEIEIEIGPYVAVFVLGLALVDGVVSLAVDAFPHVVDCQLGAVDQPLLAVESLLHF